MTLKVSYTRKTRSHLQLSAVISTIFDLSSTNALHLVDKITNLTNYYVKYTNNNNNNNIHICIAPYGRNFRGAEMSKWAGKCKSIFQKVSSRSMLKILSCILYLRNTLLKYLAQHWFLMTFLVAVQSSRSDVCVSLSVCGRWRMN